MFWCCKQQWSNNLTAIVFGPTIFLSISQNVALYGVGLLIGLYQGFIFHVYHNICYDLVTLCSSTEHHPSSAPAYLYVWTLYAFVPVRMYTCMSVCLYTSMPVYMDTSIPVLCKHYTRRCYLSQTLSHWVPYCLETENRSPKVFMLWKVWSIDGINTSKWTCYRLGTGRWMRLIQFEHEKSYSFSPAAFKRLRRIEFVSVQGKPGLVRRLLGRWVGYSEHLKLDPIYTRSLGVSNVSVTEEYFRRPIDYTTNRLYY